MPRSAILHRSAGTVNSGPAAPPFSAAPARRCSQRGRHGQRMPQPGGATGHPGFVYITTYVSFYYITYNVIIGNISFFPGSPPCIFPPLFPAAALHTVHSRSRGQIRRTRRPRAGGPGHNVYFYYNVYDYGIVGNYDNGINGYIKGVLARTRAGDFGEKFRNGIQRPGRGDGRAGPRLHGRIRRRSGRSRASP